MIESHEVENGGLEVVDVYPLVNGGETELVGSPIAHAALYAAARHPDGISVVVVVPALLSLRSGSSSEFSTPDDEGLVQQSPGLEILDKGGDALVAGIRKGLVSSRDIAMAGIPGDVVSADGVGELDAAHPSFHQTAGDQAALGVFAVSIEVPGGLGFLLDIEDIRNGKLHAEGHFHCFDASFQSLVTFATLKVHFIEHGQEVGLLALLGA